MLSAIYGLAVALAVLAVLIALGVIITRVIRTQSAARRARRKERMLRGILRAIDQTDTPTDVLRDIAVSPRIARDIFAELAEVIRGGSRTRLVALGSGSLAAWLRAQLAKAPPQDRRMAAEVLRLFDDADTIIALRRALHDKAGDVQLAAALALAELGHPLPVATMVARLRAGTEQHSLLLRRLFRLVVAQASADLLQVAEGVLGAPELRPIAIGALASTGRSEFSETFRLLVHDPDLDVRAAALTGFAALGHPDVADVVRDAMSDPAWQVRVAAVNAARRLDLAVLVPSLIDCLDDEVWWVAFRAAEALAAFGEQGVAALRSIAASEAERAGRMAAMVMAERRLA